MVSVAIDELIFDPILVMTYLFTTRLVEVGSFHEMDTHLRKTWAPTLLGGVACSVAMTPVSIASFRFAPVQLR